MRLPARIYSGRPLVLSRLLHRPSAGADPGRICDQSHKYCHCV